MLNKLFAFLSTSFILWKTSHLPLVSTFRHQAFSLVILAFMCSRLPFLIFCIWQLLLLRHICQFHFNGSHPVVSTFTAEEWDLLQNHSIQNLAAFKYSYFQVVQCLYVLLAKMCREKHLQILSILFPSWQTFIFVDGNQILLDLLLYSSDSRLQLSAFQCQLHVKVVNCFQGLYPTMSHIWFYFTTSETKLSSPVSMKLFN